MAANDCRPPPSPPPLEGGGGDGAEEAESPPLQLIDLDPFVLYRILVALERATDIRHCFCVCHLFSKEANVVLKEKVRMIPAPGEVDDGAAAAAARPPSPPTFMHPLDVTISRSQGLMRVFLTVDLRLPNADALSATEVAHRVTIADAFMAAAPTVTWTDPPEFLRRAIILLLTWADANPLRDALGTKPFGATPVPDVGSAGAGGGSAGGLSAGPAVFVEKALLALSTAHAPRPRELLRKIVERLRAVGLVTGGNTDHHSLAVDRGTGGGVEARRPSWGSAADGGSR